MLIPETHREERARLATVRDLGLLNPEKDEALERIIRIARMIFDVPISAFSVIGAEHQMFKASVGLSEQQTRRDISFCGHTILQTDLFEIADASADARFQDNPLVTDGLGIRFYAGVPVHAPDGLPVGSLCLIDRIPRQLDARQRQALFDLRDVLQNELALRTTIFRDHLTQLFNRRFLDDFLQRETRRAYRENLPLTVMLIDVDHFKAFNDVLGHVAGDEALRKIAGMIETSCQRAGDIAARYGGEEFAVVLPHTDEIGATVVSNRLKDLLEAEPIANPGGIGGVVTVSVGAVIATARSDLAHGYLPLLRAADRMLYLAKRSGRNRLEISTYSMDI